MTEPWVDKRGLAEHLCCSVRSIQTVLAEGLPHSIIFGRVKFQVAPAEEWLEEHGYLVRCNGDHGTLDTDKSGGPAAHERPGPGHEE